MIEYEEIHKKNVQVETFDCLFNMEKGTNTTNELELLYVIH